MLKKKLSTPSKAKENLTRYQRINSDEKLDPNHCRNSVYNEIFHKLMLILFYTIITIFSMIEKYCSTHLKNLVFILIYLIYCACSEKMKIVYFNEFEPLCFSPPELSFLPVAFAEVPIYHRILYSILGPTFISVFFLGAPIPISPLATCILAFFGQHRTTVVLYAFFVMFSNFSIYVLHI